MRPFEQDSFKEISKEKGRGRAEAEESGSVLPDSR